MITTRQLLLNRVMLLGWLALLVLYWQGISGIFFIDDDVNLAELASVQDYSSAKEFVLSGEAGPLGRPVALISFLPHTTAYPDNPKPFLAANIFIHVINALLLALLVSRLQYQLPQLLGNNKWLAPSVALLWGALPILVSTSMMVIQRMTSLSALFMLLGLHSYLWGRASLVVGNSVKLISAIVAFGVCTLLAVLSKESGALLPALALVMQYCLFSDRANPQTVKWNHNWGAKIFAATLWLPTLLVLAYLAQRLPSIEASYWNRPFTVYERLASESVILWEYLKAAFVPQLMDLSPFRDDYPIRQFSDVVVKIALTCWLILIIAAIVLYKNKKPLLLFGVAWFLVGHLLESTIVPLFLYFEHRNYIPLIGPVLVLCVTFLSLPVNHYIKVGLAALYSLFIIGMLWQTITIWGDRQQLIWAKEHPDSPRALQMLAGAYMRVGKVKEVDQLYEAAITRNPQLSSVAVQGLRASCYLKDGGNANRKWVEYAKKSLISGDFSHLTIQSLTVVVQLQTSGRCQGLTTQDMLALTENLQANPKYKKRFDRFRLHVLKAQLYVSANNIGAAIDEYKRAIKLEPEASLLTQTFDLVQQDKSSKNAEELVAWAEAIAINRLDKNAQKEWYKVLQSIKDSLVNK